MPLAVAFRHAFAVAFILVCAAQAKSPEIFTGFVQGVAVGGYDPVAYFTERKPVQARPTSLFPGRARPGGLPARKTAMRSRRSRTNTRRNMAATAPMRWPRARPLKAIPGHIKAADTSWPGVLN